ncbi:tetratricopeptide repeat protein [Selenomonas dianae]|uniref:Tetratricopeptide repeat protein n=1 Tax=Selenomonas dianae TaxID=135079 RepID=A0ABP3CR92_9FIRM|nr:tetratricopeptide repeat protein [Selenomonas dianae]WLD82533.1 tetratricopeptide repeat protein [Selenomonas dianae]
MTLLEQCQRWHENEEYQKIITEIEALPSEERTPELDSELARAYNNAAGAEDRAYFEKAIGLLAPHADYFKGDHLWNFRMGYSYYYLDREDCALPHFEAALAALPDDADTERMIESCHKGLSLPFFQRPFRIRVQEAWAAFENIEADLRALMDAEEDRGEELIARCEAVLRIALSDAAFEMGCGGEKYELILTPEGTRVKLFPLVYFARHAPASVREHWDIHVGRTASLGALRTGDYSIERKDVTTYFTREDKGIALMVYCEKLLPLLKEDENRAWWMLSTLVDQALGEIASIRLIHDFEVLDAPREEPSILLADLPKALEEAGFSLAGDAEDYLEHSYLAYEREPQNSSDTDWRFDVYTGSTRLPAILSAYTENDPALADMYHADGIAAGFLAYPLTDELRADAEAPLAFRDALMTAIERDTKELDAVTFLGGATGTDCGYLDFLAWDLHAVLCAADDFLQKTNLPWAVFHSFRRDANSVSILDRTEEENSAEQESPAAAKSSLLSPAAVKKMEAMDDGSEGYFYKMLYYLEQYIKNGVIKGNFTREEARADLGIALWYAYACNNIDDYEYYYRTTQWMPHAEKNAGGCGTFYYRYAVALMYCGRLEDALRAAEKGACEEPDYPWTYLQLGKLRAHFGDRSGALDAVAKGLALVPDDHEFLTLKREIHAGATIEQMSYHWIDPDFDRELQEAAETGTEMGEDMYEKQRAISCMTVSEEGLAYFRQLFRPDPKNYKKDAPYCSFDYPVGDTSVRLVFHMNEAGLSKRSPAWLRTQKERLDGGAWLSHTDEAGTGTLTAVHFELDNQVTLEYQYPWQEKSVYIPLDEDGNPRDEE